jgi:predicted Zn-dependent protease
MDPGKRPGNSLSSNLPLAASRPPGLSAGYLVPFKDLSYRERVEMVGRNLVALSIAAKLPYTFDFHVLVAPRTANAFVLPGGQVYITDGLLDRLQTEGELAGVLSHEIGHVISENSTVHIAGRQRMRGLTVDFHGEAAGGLSTEQLRELELSRENEIKADFFGMCILFQAGYDPNELIRVMQVLEMASEGASRLPEYVSTHPNPGSRIRSLQENLDLIGQCPR